MRDNFCCYIEKDDSSQFSISLQHFQTGLVFEITFELHLFQQITPISGKNSDGIEISVVFRSVQIFFTEGHVLQTYKTL